MKFGFEDTVVIISNKNNDPKFKIGQAYFIIANHLKINPEFEKDKMSGIVVSSLAGLANKSSVYYIAPIGISGTIGKNACVVLEDELISEEVYNSPLYKALSELSEDV